MLMRYHSAGMRAIESNPQTLYEIHDAIARWEAKVLESYRLLGEWDQCTIFEAPDNFKAYRATLAQELGTTADTEILPAIDFDLFSRLVSTEAGSVGPHRWQITWWARIGRRLFRWHAYDRFPRALAKGGLVVAVSAWFPYLYWGIVEWRGDYWRGCKCS